jgi:Abnormal spindle-like microcephaly-assoc'd, ASPM-SPD-2-Hydin
MKVPQAHPPQQVFFLFLVVLPIGSAAQSTEGRKLLLASPTSQAFGTVQVGSSRTLSETVTNSGSRDITISQITASGSGFKVQGFSLPLVLAGGQSYTFSAVFSPAVASNSTGSVAVLSDASNPNLSIPLSGSGTAAGQLSANPSSLGFGSVLVGSSKTLSMSLAASGTPVTITGASSTNSEFTISGISFPVTVAAGTAVSFNAVFTAKATGSASGTLNFTSNAANSPTVESTTGSGSTTQPHNVTLSWQPASTAAGYNVYRSIASGGPYSKINPVLNASGTYVDSSVAGGKTYYYVTTAVSSSGAESKYSNQAAAVVPGP